MNDRLKSREKKVVRKLYEEKEEINLERYDTQYNSTKEKKGGERKKKINFAIDLLSQKRMGKIEM